ncbi:hypothetical protein [Bradyrhizobium sp. th.b2]|uniref:hypothetical protein n=1 Tax=Bradyrhizobium sp. th-b2 TaxID=172088 RepID=UPI0003F871A5|nr:hypothetical protein [Bradyrhizobium sp. th.b2]
MRRRAWPRWKAQATGPREKKRAQQKLKERRLAISSQVGAESEPLQEVKPWMDLLIRDIEANELRRYERQARIRRERDRSGTKHGAVRNEGRRGRSSWGTSFAGSAAPIVAFVAII